MKSKVIVVLALIFLGTGWLAVAQPGKGPGPSVPQEPVARTLFEVVGPVAEVHLGLGQGVPFLVVAQQKVALAPYRFLEAAGFEVKVGDVVRIEAFDSIARPGEMIAVQIENQTQGVSVELRDSTGTPLWAAGRPGRSGRSGRGSGPRGSGDCGGSPDVESATTFTATVAEVDAGLRQRHPTITLADGSVLAAGPYRVWVDAGFELVSGETATFTAFPCSAGDGKLVLMSVEKADGSRLVLRDDEGIPLRGSGRNSEKRAQPRRER